MEHEVDIDMEAPPQLGFIQTELTETGTNYHMDPSIDNNVQHNTGNSPENAFISPMHIDSIEPQDFFTIKYPGASATYGRSATFYEKMQDTGQCAEERAQNIFLPLLFFERLGSRKMVRKFANLNGSKRPIFPSSICKYL